MLLLLAIILSIARIGVMQSRTNGGILRRNDNEMFFMRQRELSLRQKRQVYLHCQLCLRKEESYGDVERAADDPCFVIPVRASRRCSGSRQAGVSPAADSLWT
jgi:hypothetical protein